MSSNDLLLSLTNPIDLDRILNNNCSKGSDCGSVGRAVASNTIGPWFESSHRQTLFWTFVYCQLCWKDENKEKRPRMAQLNKLRPKTVGDSFVSIE